MFCKNCGNKLNDNDEFCSKCGIKNDYINEKNKITESIAPSVLLVLTILLVLIAMTLAMVFESEGLLFLILSPVVLMPFVTVVLAVISIYNFIKDKKNNLKISKTRFIFTIINIIIIGFYFFEYIILPRMN